MKPRCNHKSDWLVSFFILFYFTGSQVKAKFSSIMNSRVKSFEQTYDESKGIMICDWCRDFHYKRLKLPSPYIPSEEEIKSSPFVYGCFSFRVGNQQNHCKQSNHFHHRPTMRSIISPKKNQEVNHKQIELKSCSLPAKESTNQFYSQMHSL